MAYNRETPWLAESFEFADWARSRDSRQVMLGRALLLHLAAALLAPTPQNGHPAVLLPSDGAERLGSQGRALDPAMPEPPEEPAAPSVEPATPEPDGPEGAETPPSDRPNAPPEDGTPGQEPPDQPQPPRATPVSPAPQEGTEQAPDEPGNTQKAALVGEGQESVALFGVPRDQVLPPSPAHGDSERMRLSFEADGGVSLRLDKEPRGFDTEEPLDMTFGVGAWFSPAPRYALSLAYRSMGLGGARSSASDEDLALQRDLDTLLLGGRTYPMLGDQLGVFLQLELGGTWQRMAAHGTASGLRFSCTASEGPALMLGAGVGVDVILDRSVSFVAIVDGSAHRLGHDVVDDCAPGSGSVTSMAAQVGFVYRIQLGEEPAG